MNHFRPKSAALLFALALLGACASPGGRLQQAGSTAEVFDMRLDSDLAWARIKTPRQELWTIDGPGLNSLTVYNDIKPGEHVFQLGRERKSNPNGPWFRPGSRSQFRRPNHRLPQLPERAIRCPSRSSALHRLALA